MANSEKIGIGIITCNRPEFFIKCFRSIPQVYSKLIVVNDGADFADWEKLNKEKQFKYVHNETNLGVGKSKNIAFKYLLKEECEYIFLIEDDIIVKDPLVFEKYITASKVTGLHHFNFGYHGPANRGSISKGKPQPRFIVDYGAVKIAINGNSVGAFSFYTKKALEDVGLLDEEYTNAFEHVDHDYRMFLKKYYTPYWNFADIANSYELLDEIECSEFSSAIRPRPDWKKNIEQGAKIFEKKFKYAPAWDNRVPDTSKEDVIKLLKEVAKK